MKELKEVVYRGSLCYRTDKVKGITNIWVGIIDDDESSIFEILRPFLDKDDIEIRIKEQ